MKNLPKHQGAGPQRRGAQCSCIGCIGLRPTLPTPLILCVSVLNINYQRSKLGYRRKTKLNATTQQFITAKISGCGLKQRSKTYSSLLQSNLQRQNQAPLMSCRIRAVEHRKCAAGLAGAHLVGSNLAKLHKN